MGDIDSDFQEAKPKRRKVTPNVPVPNAADTKASDPVLTARMPSGTLSSTITYKSRQCNLAAASKTHSHSLSDGSYEETSDDSDDFRDDGGTSRFKRSRQKSAATRVRPPSAKHTWVSVRRNDDGSPFLFTGFTAAYAYMHDEFAVKGCDGMPLIDRGGDATKWAVVYRYACAYRDMSCWPACLLLAAPAIPFFPFLPLEKRHRRFAHSPSHAFPGGPALPIKGECVGSRSVARRQWLSGTTTMAKMDIKNRPHFTVNVMVRALPHVCACASSPASCSLPLCTSCFTQPPSCSQQHASCDNHTTSCKHLAVPCHSNNCVLHYAVLIRPLCIYTICEHPTPAARLTTPYSCSPSKCMPS